MFWTFTPDPELHWSMLRFEGPDAMDLLHRITTLDVRNLSDGGGSPGFLLTAQGKVRSYFHLWRRGPSEFLFELDAGSDGKWKGALMQAIDQLTFAEKVQLTDLSEYRTLWVFTEGEGDLPWASLKAVETRPLGDDVETFHHGTRDYGRNWLSFWGKPNALAKFQAEHLQNASAVSFETIESWRIQALSPRVGAELTENSIPLELGMGYGIAENKGCYPGQEVIEKIRALGSPPRRLVRIHGTAPGPQPGTSLLTESEPPTQVGEVTSVAESGAEYDGLGLVRKIYAKAGLTVKLPGSNEAQIAEVAGD